MATAPAARAEPAALTDRRLQALICSRQARCVGGSANPDEWFPLITVPVKAVRSRASHALALCASCPVRAECLELSLRQWHGAGRHGIWGGMLEPERRAIRRRWLAGVSVGKLLPGSPGQQGGPSGRPAHRPSRPPPAAGS